jgi:hypothetical protein
MKTQIFFKIFLVLPLIVFVDWMLMVAIGCASCLFGFGDSFYCGTYCIIGKAILLLSAVLFTAYLIFPQFKKTTKRKTYAQTR